MKQFGNNHKLNFEKTEQKTKTNNKNKRKRKTGRDTGVFKYQLKGTHILSLKFIRRRRFNSTLVII